MTATIRLRKLWSPARVSWKWSADTVEGGDLLRRCNAPRYFTDDQYDDVLATVSRYGVSLETPID